MSFKKLFINSDDESDKSKKEVIKPQSQTKFPVGQEQQEPTPTTNLFGFSTKPTTKPIFVGSGEVSPEHLAKAIEVYQNGFDSLNQAGYDFYEFYQAVTQAGIDNPPIYGMAFAMGVAMDKTITKEKLVQQSDFYISKINEQYNDFILKGKEKRNALVGQKDNESQALSNELNMMEQQLESLRVQIQDRQHKLNAIDGKYEPMISEIDSKLAANDTAKNQVVNSIEQVKQGIIINLK